VKAIVSAVEASYAAAALGDVAGWIQKTTAAITPILGVGVGTIGYDFDARGEIASWSISPPFVHDGPEAFASGVSAMFATAPAGVLTSIYRVKDRVTTASELFGCTLDQVGMSGAAALSDTLGMRDLVSIHAGDTARGTMFAVGLPRRRALRPTERWSLARLAAHLASARRLVGAIGELEPAATFAASGKLLDASPRVQDDAGPLRAAVLAMERARGELSRRAPEESLRIWRALVDGHYSLVERFESDGKRFVIAYENPPGAVDPRGLTRRERAVAGLLALALPDRQLAYELGLSEGTVRAHVHAVLHKLGVATRAQALSALVTPSLARVLSLGPALPELVVFSDEHAGPALDALSPSERAVADLAARGHSTRAIAERRGRSAGTVTKQLASVFTKLGVESRSELALVILGVSRPAPGA